MPAPHLDTCCFPKLSSSPNKDNPGTVTGPNIGAGDTVTIRSKTTTKVWSGQVTTLISGNSWNAVVRRKQEKEERATETVGVTVTNSGGESNEVPQDPEIVP
jgi:hypothetical protein